MDRWINGNGALKSKGVEFGNAEFKILVGRGRADGRMWADVDVIQKAFEDSSVTLTLPDGREIDIVVTAWTPGQDASFAVNTPLR